MRGIVYEFPTGTVAIGANYAFSLGGGTISSPTLSGLTGTYSMVAARSHGLTGANGVIEATWAQPSTKDYEVALGAAGGSDGVGLSVAYQDGMTSGSCTASYSMMWDNTGVDRGEGAIFALSIPEGPPEPEPSMVNTLRLGGVAPEKLYLGTAEVTRVYLGTTLVYGRSSQEAVPTLSMTPDGGSYAVGDTIYVTIHADSQSAATNVVQANFTYPTDRLTYQYIDTSMSAYTSSIQEGAFAGEVKIGVGILDGDVSGDQVVAVVAFTATGAGSVELNFTSDSAIVERATAENICGAMTGATYVIT